MGLNAAIDLTVEQHETVVTLIQKYLPDTTAWAYGSRVKWTSRPNSDLDIVVFASSEQSRQISDLRNAFGESDLPFRVDLFVWDTVPDMFRENIEVNHVVLMESRNMTALQDIVDLRISSVDKKIKIEEHSVTLCNYMDVYKNSFIHPDIRFMDGTATEVEISKFSLNQDDVIITKDSERYDDIGVPALVRHDIDNLVCGYHLAMLRPDASKVYGPYLYYALNTDEAKIQFRSYANGVTRFGLRKADIGRLEIPLPDISTQRIIADMLVALDDKIELNRRMNHTLQEIAFLLYREWFVHFRFPGNEDVELVDSDLGLIPDGWEYTTLGRAAKWISGGTPSTRESAYWGGDIPWITSGSLTSFLLDDSERKLTQLGVDNGSKTVDRNATIFVVRGMSLAKEFRHGIADIRLAFGQDCKALVAKPGIEPLFLALAVSSLQDKIQGMVEFAAHGTGKLSTGRIQALAIPCPPESIQQLFIRCVEPMRELMSNLQRQNRALREARDLLLPRLVSGELDVSELDSELEILEM